MNKMLNHNLLCSAPYDAKLKLHRPQRLISLVFFNRKSDAVQYAKKIGWRINSVVAVGSRFCRGWGLRWDYLSDLFLANPHVSLTDHEAKDNPTPEEMKALICRCMEGNH